MNGRIFKKYAQLCCVVLMLSPTMSAGQHKWAGRDLTDFESAIHERLASLPMRAAFETINFEVRDNGVILSGHVLSDRLRQSARKAVTQVDGVGKVTNHIQVLPSSRRDDLLRVNVYRAIYKVDPPQGPDSADAPRIHIIVENGWVSLEGTVNSRADRDAAHLAALKVSPHVTDYLRVVGDEDPRHAGS